MTDGVWGKTELRGEFRKVILSKLGDIVSGLLIAPYILYNLSFIIMPQETFSTLQIVSLSQEVS